MTSAAATIRSSTSDANLPADVIAATHPAIRRYRGEEYAIRCTPDRLARLIERGQIVSHGALGAPQPIELSSTVLEHAVIATRIAERHAATAAERAAFATTREALDAACTAVLAHEARASI